MPKDKADTRLPVAVVEDETGADGALAVRDALQVAKPMFHGIPPTLRS